jgi:glycosyltransferase involved in cell wall biosynthesis
MLMRPKPSSKKLPQLPHRISIVVPTLNEEGNVALLIKRIDNALAAKLSYEVIFIDDHSTDDTVKIIRQHTGEYPVHVFTKNARTGKAQSLLEGFDKVRYELIATIDADLQYAPEEIPHMVEKLLENNADLVQSRRTIRHETGFLRNLGSRVFNLFFIRFLHGLDLDTQSALKVFHRRILSKARLPGPLIWSFLSNPGIPAWSLSSTT